MAKIQMWTCKACGCEHLSTSHQIEDAYDACPNCVEITEHEWATIKSNDPLKTLAIVVEEANGEQWVYSKHSDPGEAEEVRAMTQAKLVGAKVRVCDWT